MLCHAWIRGISEIFELSKGLKIGKKENEEKRGKGRRREKEKGGKEKKKRKMRIYFKPTSYNF